jgi:hypothetical protein
MENQLINLITTVYMRSFVAHPPSLERGEKLQQSLTSRNSFDQINRHRHLKSFRYNDGIISDPCAQTEYEPSSVVENSPYIQSYDKLEAKMDQTFTSTKRVNKSVCSRQPIPTKIRAIYGQCNSLEKINYKNSVKKSFDYSYEGENSAISELYTEKIKRRRNLYDLSSITKYKSIFRLQMNQDDELQKKIIVLPQNRNTRRKHNKVSTKLRTSSIKRNETSVLNNYKSLFKIDVQQTKQKTDMMTTRKYSKTRLEVAKAEIYSKIKEISNDYSESTNINSK